MLLTYYLLYYHTTQARYNPEAKNFSKTKKTTWLAVVVSQLVYGTV